MKGTFTALACLVVAVSLALPRPALATSDAEIGYVIMQDYLGAMGERVGGENERLTYKRDVYSDQIVRTEGQSMTALRFLDDTTLQVGQSGQVVIEFTKGVFRFVTGEMTNLEGFELRTPTALIGIRGTDFKVGVDDTGATTVAVMAGEVEVSSRSGEASASAAAGQSVGVSAAGDVSGVSSGDAVGSSMGLGDTAGGDGAGFGGGSGGGGDSGGGGGSGGCFAADTAVWMADGSYRRIADVRVGDAVMSFDFVTGTRVASVVEKVHVLEADGYLRLNGIEVTATHPFAVGADAWREAGELEPGDRLVGLGEAAVESLERVPGGLTVFNMTVDGTHNFYVAESGAAGLLTEASVGGESDVEVYLVHNKGQ